MIWYADEGPNGPTLNESNPGASDGWLADFSAGCEAHCRLAAAAPDLARCLGRLLDGLDANREGDCQGLSAEEWERRVAEARALLDSIPELTAKE